MEPATLIIPAVLTAILALLCLIAIAVRIPWIAKATVIVSVSGVCFLVWSAMDSYRGWAATQEPPETFRLIWIEIREPRPVANDPGAIYLWLRPLEPAPRNLAERLLGYEPTLQEPRTYRLPYSRTQHEIALQATNLIKEGVAVMGKQEGGNAQAEGDAGDARAPGTRGRTAEGETGGTRTDISEEDASSGTAIEGTKTVQGEEPAPGTGDEKEESPSANPRRGGTKGIWTFTSLIPPRRIPKDPPTPAN